MRLGDRNRDVIEVQKFLISKGLLTPKEINGRSEPPETIYGVKTKRAVIKLQELLDLEPTGIWDESLFDIYSLKEETIPYLVNSKRMGADGVDNYSPVTAVSSNSSVIETPTFTTTECPRGTRFTDHEIDCYVLNRLTGTKIDFGISPDEVSESNSAMFDDAQILGRSSPFKGYNSSGPRSVSFTISLYADYCPMGIIQTVNAIRALVYPKYADVIRSPNAYFKLGKFISIKGVVNSVSVSWRKPFRDGYYLFADVSIDMDEVDAVGKSVEEVEARG